MSKSLTTLPSRERHLFFDPRVRYAVDLLDQHELTKPLNLSAIAAQLNLSPSRFRHLFKSQVGVSPMRYVKSARLRAARVLFRDSYLGVKEVAWRVGYSDISHFVRAYKEEYGETPSETKKHFTKAHPKSFHGIVLPLKRASA